MAILVLTTVKLNIFGLWIKKKFEDVILVFGKHWSKFFGHFTDRLIKKIITVAAPYWILIVKHLSIFFFIGSYFVHLCTCSGCPLHITQIQLGFNRRMIDFMTVFFRTSFTLDASLCISGYWVENRDTYWRKTMEMLYEWWRWFCHSLCQAMTMTYKIQNTALSHVTLASLHQFSSNRSLTARKMCAKQL